MELAFKHSKMFVKSMINLWMEFSSQYSTKMAVLRELEKEEIDVSDFENRYTQVILSFDRAVRRLLPEFGLSVVKCGVAEFIEHKKHESNTDLLATEFGELRLSWALLFIKNVEDFVREKK